MSDYEDELEDEMTEAEEEQWCDARPRRPRGARRRAHGPGGSAGGFFPRPTRRLAPLAPLLVSRAALVQDLAADDAMWEGF